MTKEEFKTIVDFANQSANISESAKNDLNEILENANDSVLLLNATDNRYVDYPEYWTRETIDMWLESPLTDDEFNELSCRLSHLGSYNSDDIMYEINEIRSDYEK